MSKKTSAKMPDAQGHFGPYGGRFVPETLMHPLQELENEYLRAQKDPAFKREFEYYLREFCGRPTPLYFAERLTRELGGAKIYLKRETCSTPARTKSTTLSAKFSSPGAWARPASSRDRRGPARRGHATVAAMFGLKCVVYMGAVDCERQALNVYRMKMLGAEVVSVKAGQQTLKEAITKPCATGHQHPHYALHPRHRLWRASVPAHGPEFPALIGDEARRQILKQEKRLPDLLVACVGGGSNAMGLFYPFLKDKSVKMVGVEAGGRGIKPNQHAARFHGGSLGVLQGTRSYILQDKNGQIQLTHSVSAGLDYAAVGPEHAWLHDRKRVEYTTSRTMRRWQRS